MSYLGPDWEDCVGIKRYVFPERALWALERTLSDLQHQWREEPPTHVVEIGPLPLPVTDEEFEEMVKDDTEIM